MCNEAPRRTMYIVSFVCKAMHFTVASVGTYFLQKSVYVGICAVSLYFEELWSLYAVSLALSLPSSFRSVDLSSHGGAFG